MGVGAVVIVVLLAGALAGALSGNRTLIWVPAGLVLGAALLIGLAGTIWRLSA